MTKMLTAIAAPFVVLLIAGAALGQRDDRPDEGRPGDRPREGRPAEGRDGLGLLPVLRALDADGNGEISAEEIENAAKALKTLDTNKDGKLTRDELLPRGGVAGAGGPGGGAAFIARLMERDENGDGKLSKEELGDRGAQFMERGDTNKDGFLDKKELGEMGARQRGGRPGDEGGEGRPPRRPDGDAAPARPRGDEADGQPRPRNR